MEDKTPISILLIIFVILGFAWKPIQESKRGTPRNSSAVGQQISGQPEKQANIVPTSNKEISEGIKDIEDEVEDLEKDISKVIALSKRSPYYGKVKMSSRVSGLRQNNPSREYVTITTSLDKDESVKITGWYLQSEVTNYYAVIGKAALLPFPFTRTETDIILQKSDRVYLTKGFSPIGISFRTNKCTGYFEEDRTFYPSLPRQCPQPEDESLPQFSNNYDRNEECIEIIERVPRCTVPDSKFIYDLPDTVNRACRSYLAEQINYNTCVARHVGDTDFPGNQYRVYLNRFGPLWREKSDTINLHDENGLIVDTISY